MRRRSLLKVLGAGSLSLAGCLADAPDAATRTTQPEGTQEEGTRTAGTRDRSPTTAPDPDGTPTSQPEELPDECPKSQDLGIEWPRNLDQSAVDSFVERYEEAYYKQAVIDTLFEAQSRLFTYRGWISRVKSVTATSDGGWRVKFSGIVNIQRGDLILDATIADPPSDAEVTPVSELEDEKLIAVLEKAAETGNAGDMIRPEQTDAYLDRFEELSDDFEITEVGDSGTLYFDVDGLTIELGVYADPPNRDHFWDAWYYVDEHVVWRSDDAEIDPRDGTLLECRPAS